ncbi:DASH complex subunit Dam1-domain-containing protein [Flagelloscypha sp. PMI_526]|nr:DASH complex subunit Dam1-domain-containing protein [Flagelloscypha sp. PMI_526]
MPPPTPHRTPLKRVSQGSLFRLSRSQAYPDAPHGLGFLEPAMSEFADETEVLAANLEGLTHLRHTLAVFNESFASWLYVMNMNALTVDWPQAPTEASFICAKKRAERDAMAALNALNAQTRASEQAATAADRDKTTITEGETTFTAQNTTGPSSASAVKKVVKKGGKAKLTAKEKKERSIILEKVISTMPLEFRGSDPTLRRNMESVIEGLLDAPQAVKLHDLIKPDCNQARVNKCLIALVGRKIVKKDNSTGQVLYHWQGMAT